MALSRYFESVYICAAVGKAVKNREESAVVCVNNLAILAFNAKCVTRWSPFRNGKFGVWGTSAATSNFASGRHRVEDTRHNLRGARPTRFVRELRFEQLGIRENDAELIVQAVKEKAEI